MSDPLKPSASVLCKIGSVFVHVEELLGSDGHHFDRDALASVFADEEVREWLAGMDELALIPKKRSAPPVSKEHALSRGWGETPVSRKAHYFREGSSTSICGKIGFFMGEREDFKHDSPDNCAECRKRREKTP